MPKNRPSKKVREAEAQMSKAEVKNMIKSIVGQEEEKKYFDTYVNASADIDWLGTVLPVTSIPQNVTDTGRVGDNVLLKELTYSFYFKFNQNATFTSSVNVARVIIFSWKPFFASVAPSVTGVLQYNGNYSAAHGPVAHDNKGQYKIHLDKSFVLDGASTDVNLVRGRIKLNQKVQFKAGSTTDCSNGVFVLFISDAAAGVGPYPKIADWIVRLDFKDA